ncbi:MAG: PilZ domain-containing protein [Thermodesulfovibrionales bacterium]|nr:PilZ domain-containing protein [Thermodesulfovibrionales bacterium]
MIDRCLRICGGFDSCFIQTKKHIECLSDILINKAFGTSEILEQILKECNEPRMVSLLQEALRSTYEIMNWVKYLQIASDLKFTSEISKVSSNEKRRHLRYPVPEVIRRYINLTIDAEGKMIEGIITNISQQGLQFIIKEPLKPGKIYSLKISTIRTASKELILKIKVVYCKRNGVNFISGAFVAEMPDELSFNFFKNVLDLFYSISV